MENKDKLKTKINEYINKKIDEAAEKDEVEYFDIEISCHNKSLNLKFTSKQIVKI